jgi:TetR/AcrR family transcriptional repressor of multidrug resistance operon
MTHTGQPAQRPPRRRDARGTRERLARAALELFTTQGYHASTTPQIATKAGVAEGTIYRHFTSKEHLLNEIYRSAVRLFTNAIQDSRPQLPCRERLEQIATAWRDLATREPAMVRLVFVSRIGALLDDKSREVQKELREEFERLIASGKAAGDVRPGPVDLWAEVWLRLAVLVLERVASREWPAEHPGPKQVLESAWDAIRAQRPVSTPPAPIPPGSPAPDRA